MSTTGKIMIRTETVATTVDIILNAAATLDIHASGMSDAEYVIGNLRSLHEDLYTIWQEEIRLRDEAEKRRAQYILLQTENAL